VKISKTEYAVDVYYKLESKYKKSSKFEEVIVQNKKKSLISNGMRHIQSVKEPKICVGATRRKSHAPKTSKAI
jgi:hypothetical protein